jgi:hypothetical protein
LVKVFCFQRREGGGVQVVDRVNNTLDDVIAEVQIYGFANLARLQSKGGIFKKPVPSHRGQTNLNHRRLSLLDVSVEYVAASCVPFFPVVQGFQHGFPLQSIGSHKNVARPNLFFLGFEVSGNCFQ